MRPTGVIWLLFGYRGRISRSQFWMAPAIYLGGLLVSLILSAVFSWLLFVIFFAGLVCADGIGVAEIPQMEFVFNHHAE